LKSLVAIILLNLGVCVGTQANQENKTIRWRKPEECIAGTPASRRRAARSLGVGRGRWVVAYFSAYCSDCDRAAVELNRVAGSERVLGLTLAPAAIAKRWRQELGLKYRVISVSERTFEDLGAVILPTVVLFEDGEAKGAYTPSVEER
jgi:hypothetical protein